MKNVTYYEISSSEGIKRINKNSQKASEAVLLQEIAKVVEKVWKDPFPLIIAHLTNDAFDSVETFSLKSLGIHKIRCITNPENVIPLGKNYSPKPLIVIGNEILNEPEPNKIKERFDQRYLFWDSSIWHRYLHIQSKDVSKTKEEFESKLRDILTTIKEYSNLGLYDTVISQEFLEFQCRKLNNSYLAEINGNSGHKKEVVPYRFHSETKMKEKADLLAKKLQGNKWGCVLIDDFFQKPLRLIEKKQTDINKSNSERNKSNVLLKLINLKDLDLIEILNADETDPNEEYLDKGLNWIKEKYPHADIIIVDYFLGKSSNNEHKFGHSLLQLLLDENNPHRPLLDRYWIFPISVFDRAFQNHLLSIGQSQIDEKIVLGEGADPVNTPELFRYLFYQFLEAHLNTNGVKLEFIAREILVKFENSKKKLGISDDNLKLAVTERYHEIVALSSGLNKIRQAANTSSGPASVFASTYLQKIDPNKNLVLLCNQIQQLAYLIAYGNAVEWPRMWEKLLATKTILNNTSIKREYFDKLLNEINTYIIELSKIT